MVPNFMRELTFHTRSMTSGAPAESFTLDRPRAGLSTVHTDTLYAAALAGMGITGLPSFVAEEALLENALERVLPCWHLLSTTIYAGMPTRKHVPARTRVFIDFLVETFGGEDRDPWLLAAGCETLPLEPPAAAGKSGKKKAALAVA
jgi:DNA-binding transcriptional LysR family regulator